ncbi:MAG: hypothetical protein J5486_01095 [Bacteroidaceae bacterium]|nr:hypothetical protein [Bacteroidaceae bacterium]
MSVINRLRIFYIAILACAAAVALLYELDIATVGLVSTTATVRYILECVCVMAAIVLIPLALKLLTFKPIRQRIVRSERDYERWSLVRIAMLATALHLNLSQYYMLELDTTCGCLALMTLVTFLYVWPSRERMDDERTPMES